jgi:hypothetical protein
MSELGELYADWKKEKQAKKECNRIGSEDILIQRGIKFKKFTADHWRVGDWNYWPATGLFIHVKEKKRGRGVFNLIKKLEGK